MGERDPMKAQASRLHGVGWILVPLAVWMLLVSVSVTVVALVLDAERTSLQQEFVAETVQLATHVADHVAADQEAGAELAEVLLADETLDAGRLQSVVTGMGYTVGAVFDGDGRMLLGSVSGTDLVGQDFRDRLEHLRIASQEQRPAVSQATVSPSIATPAVGLAVPYDTDHGRRILTLVGALQDRVLRQTLEDVGLLRQVEVDVLDRNGMVIATTARALSDEVVPYDEFDPAAASARGRAPVTFQDQEGTSQELATAPVGDTGWELASRTSSDALYAPLVRGERTAWTSVWALAAIGLAVVVALTGSRRRRRAAEQQVRDLNQTLQERIEERTATLEATNAELAVALASARAGERAAKRLATVVDAAGEAIIGEGTDYTITSWNEAARRLYGYTAAEAIGQPMTMLVEPGGEAAERALLLRALEGETVQGEDAVRISREGFRRHVSISKAPIRDADGEVIGAVDIHLDLTPQRLAEDAEREAQAMFVSVFRDGAAPQGVTDMTGRFVRVNQALCRLLGYSEEELLLMNVRELTRDEDRKETLAYMEEFRTGRRRSIQLVKRYRHRDGHAVITTASLNRVDDLGGQPRWIVGMLHDITEEVRAQELIAQREAMLSSVSASVGNITMMYDLAGTCVFAAGAGLRELGMSPEDLVDTGHLTELVDDPHVVAAFLRAVRGDDADVIAEVAGRVFDARLRPVRHDGVVTHVAVGAHDITEQQRTQEAVVASERRLDAVVRNAADAICQLTPDGTILYATPAIGQLVGVGPEEVEGRNMADFIVDEDLPGARRELRLVTARADEIEGSLRMVHVDGTVRHVEYSITNALADDAVRALVATMHDVTERTQMAQLQREYVEQLETLNRELKIAAEVRDNILDATTHELRTPLTPAVGMLEVIRRRWHRLDDETRQEYFQVIERNIGRIAALVEDLLLASRMKTGAVTATVERVTVADHVEQALACWPEVCAEVTVHGPDQIRAWCEPHHLDQMLKNLLSNAVTYGAAPYRIEISRADEDVRIGVVDHGSGVPEAVSDRMFDPFVQGTSGDRRTAHGLGLGLYIARTLARANGGNLTHRGAAGPTRFVITLRSAMAGHEPPATVSRLAQE